MNKFSKNANLLLYCLVVNTITSIFIYTYLLAFIINISNNNVINVAIFYITLHISMIIFSWLMAPFFKKFKKTTSLKLGILGKLLFVCVIVLSQDYIINFVPLIAICNAFSEVVFWGGANSLQSEISKTNSLSMFISVSKAFGTITNFIIPVIMGYFIDKTGIHSITIAMMFCVTIQIILSSFIKDNSHVNNSKLKYKEFLNCTQKENVKIKKIYTNQFLFGICSNISMLILYYTVTIFGSNLSIGIFSSVSAVIAVIVLAIYNRNKKLFKHNIFYIITSFLIILSVICVLIELNKVSLILFYTIWNISIIVPETITSARRLKVVKNKNLQNYNIENVTISETYLDFGRILGEMIILIMAIINNNIFNIICLLLITLIIPIYLIHTSLINR